MESKLTKLAVCPFAEFDAFDRKQDNDLFMSINQK